MQDWTQLYLELGQKLNQVCTHQDILQRNCISLGRMECKLLSHLACLKEAVCMNDLSLELNVSHSRITRIVDNLVKKEYVRRFPSEVDRRRWYCEVTPDGKKMSRQSLKENLCMHNRIVEKLPIDQLDQIHKSIKLYIDALEKIIDEKE